MKKLFPYMIALACAIAFVHGLACGPAMAEETSVKQIRVEGSSTLEESELLYLLDLAPGRKVDPEGVTKGIKRLFLKGFYEDIQVGMDEELEGVLIVRVREKMVLSDVSVHVHGKADEDEILEHVRLHTGDFVSHEAVEAERAHLKDVLAKLGYPNPELVLELRDTGEPYEKKFAIGVMSGEPVRIRDIVIIGRPASEVKKMLSLDVGDVFDAYAIERDLKEIDSYYRKRGYLNPEVGPYSFKDGALLIGVKSGVKLNVYFEGNEFMSNASLRDELPFREAGKFSNDLVSESVSRLQQLYADKGYPSSQIAPVVSEAENEIGLHYYIYEGRGSLLSSMKFMGKLNVPESKLQELVSVVKGQTFNPKAIEQDIDNIREFYIALGYKDAKVSLPRIGVRDGKVSVEVDIDEGRQFLINSVSIDGDYPMSEGDVQGVMKISDGVPYNEVDISDSRRALLSLCRGYGFYQCRIDVARNFAPEAVDVRFHVDTGTKFFFGKTVVTGNKRTKLKVINRNLQYSEGLPFDTALLTGTRQKLYSLGLFSDVSIDPISGSDETLDVNVRVREADAGNVEFAIGYGEYERFRGSFDISYNNLFGLNRYASFRTEHSTLWNRYVINYNEPAFMDMDIIHKSSLSYEYKKDKNIDTSDINYETRRAAISTGLEKSFAKNLLISIYYEYAIVDTFNVQPDVELSKEDSSALAISSIKPGIYFNNTDDPVEPTSGYNASLYVKMASKYLSSKTDFTKSSFSMSYYQKLFTKRVVAAAAFKGGYAERFYDTEDLPLIERFFLGGRSSVRGYPQDTLGPLSSSGTPTGGNSFLQFNLELRLKLSNSWSVVPFVDAGNVWANTSNTTVKNLKYTAGLGLRYGTPVGPLRIDYGRKLDQRDNESAGEVHFSIGHTF